MLDCEIKELSPALRDDYLAFFDRDAFADNPHWAKCYCYFNHAPHDREDWEARTGEQNRAAAADLIDRGIMHGYLAYVDGRPAGWCNANLIRHYTILKGNTQDPDRTGAITCFVVAQPYRGAGVARRLLDAACEGSRARGITLVEAYPRREAATDASNYHGPLALYLEAGFEPVSESDNIVTVQKRLHT